MNVTVKFSLVDIFTPKSIQIHSIQSISKKFPKWFDEAVDIRIEQLLNKIENIDICVNERINKNGTSTGLWELIIDDYEAFEKVSALQSEKREFESQLYSISEMKLINIFKNIELEIKNIIKHAYIADGKYDGFKWDSIITFFGAKGIKIRDLNNYEAINQIRVVNNNLKHGDEISDETKKLKIPEFSNCSTFTRVGLLSFYDRVKEQPIAFLEDLARCVVDELFKFDEERIARIANDFKNRMDHSEVQLLIEKLRSPNKR